MRPRLSLPLNFSRFVAFLLLLLTGPTLIAAEQVPADPAKPTASDASKKIPSWFLVERDIQTRLLSGERDLAEWAAEVKDREPKDMESALIKIDLLLRAGLDRHAAKAVKQLKKQIPELRFDTTEDYLREADLALLISFMYDSANLFYKARETALTILETFPERINSLGWSNDPLCDLREQGWDDARIAKWLGQMRRRAAGHPWPSWQLKGFDRNHPSLKKSSNDPDTSYNELVYWWHASKTRPEIFWLGLEARHLRSLGQKQKVERLFGELEQAVRKNPSDLSKVYDYLNAPQHGRRSSGDIVILPCEWIADVFQPQSSTAAYLVAYELEDRVPRKKLARFFEYAIKTPLKKDEFVDFPEIYQPKLRPCFSPFRPELLVGRNPPEVVKHAYRFQTRLHLSQCLMRQDKMPQARELAKEALDIAWKNHLDTTLFPDTITPNPWAPKELETRILKEEETGKTDPKYWLKRASFYKNYYRAKEAEHAYKKGLEVAKPAPRSSRNLPWQKETRAALLFDYIDLLKQKQRAKEAGDLLHDELRNAPANTESAEVAANCLVSLEGYDGPIYEDAMLWKWLEDRSDWQKKTSLLQKMAIAFCKATKSRGCKKIAELPQYRHFLKQIEKTTQNGGPADALGCGKLILTFSRDPKRAIKWLRKAVESKDAEKDLQLSATDALLEAYIEANDLENAEKILAELNVKSHRETPYYMKNLATKAVELGNQKMAMRYWKRLANWSPNDRIILPDLTTQLRQLGLGKAIDAHYREVQKNLPEFRYHP